MNNHHRIVITGIGLTAPNGNTLAEFRSNLLQGSPVSSRTGPTTWGKYWQESVLTIPNRYPLPSGSAP
jgi:hypothetical protein